MVQLKEDPDIFCELQSLTVASVFVAYFLGYLLSYGKHAHGHSSAQYRS